MSLKDWLVGMWLCALGSLMLADASLAQLDFTFSSAKNNWFYGTYGQLGDKGFFGRYNVDASSLAPAFANVNGWMGRSQRDIGITVSGSNATVAGMQLEVSPNLGSDWVNLTGRYTMNVYEANTTQGAYIAMSPGQLTMWSLDVRTPLASFGYGKRMYPQGMGLQFASGRTSELLFMERSAPVPDLLGALVSRGILPKGVLSWFNPAAWSRVRRTPEPEPADACPPENPPKEPEEPDVFDPCWPDPNPPYAVGSFGPGVLTLGFGVMPWERVTPFTPSWNDKDVNRARVNNVLGYMIYSSTDLLFAIGCLRLTSHEGPELVDDRTAPGVIPPGQSNLLRFYIPTRETYTTEGWLFVKYNNGQFFFLTELDWFNRIIRFQQSFYPQVFDPTTGSLQPVIFADGSGRSRLAPQYNESWRWAAEVGTFLGPSTFRMFYSYMPGPDLRHGILIDRQPFIQELDQAAYDVHEPFSLLLAYFYGAGMDAQGYINGASVFGAKVDYALAANLYVTGSVLKAVRNSNGFGWGHVRPNIDDFGRVEYGNYRNAVGTFAPALPTITERDLGWEYMVGATWQLVDGWVVDARFSYWKPGRWFSYACIDRAVPNWDIPVPANNWGINPDRDIDPVVGFEIRLGATY